MICSDTLGLTFIIRDLCLNPKGYESMIYFFRSSTWSLETISNKWFQVVKHYASLYYEGDSVVLIGDGIKEARKMPSVKRLHQDPITLIRLYSYRFKIECTFREMKLLRPLSIPNQNFDDSLALIVILK